MNYGKSGWIILPLVDTPSSPYLNRRLICKTETGKYGNFTYFPVSVLQNSEVWIRQTVNKFSNVK